MMRLRLFLIIPGLLFLVALLAFEFGLRKGRETARASARPKAGTEQRVDDAELIRLLLAQDLGARRFAFRDVVQASTDHAVKPAGDDPAIQTIRAAIEEAGAATLELFNGADSPVHGLRRINEASRYFEDALRTLIDAHEELTCAVPTTAEGKEQRSGYPDLRIAHPASGTVAYLDPKLFEETSRASSLRTFYYEPKVRSSKIGEDACHFLLGISHDGNDGAWTFLGAELVDLSGLKVRLKAEFQASNRDIYPENLMNLRGLENDE
jgi:hypothetical protein